MEKFDQILDRSPGIHQPGKIPRAPSQLQIPWSYLPVNICKNST